MAKYVIDEKTLTDIAESIRQKKGTTADITPEDMPSEIAGITTGEDVTAETNEYTAKLEALETAITELEAELQGKASGVTLDEIATKAIEGKVVLSVASIGSYTFLGCAKITSLHASHATAIGGYAFNGCTKLTSAYVPVVTSIGDYAFASCSVLASVDFGENVTTLGTNTFQACSKLSQVNFPNVTTVGARCFTQCYALKRIELPNLKTLGNDAFTYCSTLEYVDLGQVTSLPSWSVSNCRVLKAVVIRKADKIATLTSNALSSTPIASGTGYVYVPSALVEAYKSATNWSAYAAQIRAIEDYPDITGG